ncbi:MAG TPA: hypothetical protein EYG89_03620 [Bacteroidia bacterium]|nr:hypothetical protein [Bacteroidia bacterium]
MSKIKLTTRTFRVFFSLFLLIVLSRGFFQLFLEKKQAFLIQVIVILVFLFFSLVTFKIKLKIKYFYSQIILLSFFIISIIVSILLTKHFKNGGAPIFYSFIMLFLTFALIFISSLATNKYGFIDFGKIFITIIIILFAVSIYEQLTLFLMPGAWWHGYQVRPASLTGSKQHYSIIMALLSLLTFQYWLSLKQKKYLFGAIIGFVAVLLSLSRSGAMILVIAFFFYFFHYLYSVRKIKISLKLFFFLFLGLILVLIPLFIYTDLSYFFERVVSSIDANSPGNGGRIDSWITAIVMISESHTFVFGEYTGVVTNSTRTLTNTKSFVVESGVLQMIINFGFLGFFSFYLILLNIYTRIKGTHIFLLVLLFSALISTAVYQSIETIPFIMLLSIIPLVSDDIKTKQLA